MSQYTITLTETQLRIIQNALEEYFRVRLGQPYDLATELAFLGKDMRPENPEHDRIFSQCIDKRDTVDEILRAMFRILWPPYGTPNKKTDEMLVAECLWDAIRNARGVSRYQDVLKTGTEPAPEIRKIGQ